MTMTEPAKFVLRMPAKLHKKIRKLAKTENISMNSFIVRGMESNINPEWTIKALTQRLEAKEVI